MKKLFAPFFVLGMLVAAPAFAQDAGATDDDAGPAADAGTDTDDEGGCSAVTMSDAAVSGALIVVLTGAFARRRRS